MAVINQNTITAAASVIALFLSSPDNLKVGLHSLLLIGSAEVVVEVKAGRDDKICISAKVANCVVYRDKATRETLEQISGKVQELTEILTFRVAEALYDNVLINHSLLMKIISAVGNMKSKSETLELPGGFTVAINDVISITGPKGEPVELLTFENNGFKLSPALCIPKSIVTYMIKGTFLPFTI